MQHFMLMQKKEAGCPIGLLNMAMYDKSYRDFGSVKHGFLPWYAEHKWTGPATPLPGGLIVASKVRRPRFGVRNLFKTIYLADQDFWDSSLEAGAVFNDVQRIDLVTSSNGVPHADQGYRAIVPKILGIDALGPDSRHSPMQSSLIETYTRLSISKDVAEPLFMINGLAPMFTGLICSTPMKNCLQARRIRGVDFCPLSELSSSSIQRSYESYGDPDAAMAEPRFPI